MYSILHITDLHRAREDPLSNAELLSALMKDRESYLREDPPIRSPDAIVVSGDIIHGAGPEVADPIGEIARQYDAAYELLTALTDRFLDGDRSRVVIVPGNHDVDWSVARAAMKVVADADVPKNLAGELAETGSMYRWDWKTRGLFIISDLDLYEGRLAAFWTFFERFYKDCDDLLKVEPKSDANLFSLDEGRIAVAAFNSCSGNDCFSFRGEIPREAVAQAYMDLKDRGPWRLRIAVWHHDVEGPPHRSDYMDIDIVRGMIGRGFGLGLYGHQHRTQITPQHIDLPERETMAIASAGSLCAGRRELPTGARRGYSIIEIADDYRSAKVHVREMQVANLFSRASLPTFGGRSYVDLGWTIPPDAGGRAEDSEREAFNATVARAEAALRGAGDAEQALRLLRTASADRDPYARKLMLEAAEQVGPNAVADMLNEPQAIHELVALVDAYLATADYEQAWAALAANADRLELPAPLKYDLRQRIELMRRMRS